MSLITRDYLCPDCNTQFHLTVERGPEEDTLKRCPACMGDKCHRVFAAANVVGKASYLDGQSRGQGYENLKQVAKLEKQAANLPVEERKEIKREVDKLKKL